MPAPNHYLQNPLIHKDRRLGASGSKWVRSFTCESLRPLIICRGPIRKEAMDVFAEMGMTHVGILLSEKDSIVYANALAPELRGCDPRHVHRVKDYTGANKEERVARVQEIIKIAKTHGYDSVFAGYGFMAEDEDLVRALEQAGLRFIGPCSRTVEAAGRKDEAKKTAIKESVSVTPGLNDLTSRTLLRRYPDKKALLALAKEKGLKLASEPEDLAPLVIEVLEASYRAGIDLYSVEELSAQIQREVAQLFAQHPGNRVRLKAIGGGGGKGQRILAAPNKPGQLGIDEAAAKAPEKVREILAEVKATGVGDNKNIILELNIEQTRHNEIQLIGNGDWCISMGGRDCSLQMHEQKLLEISITQEGYQQAIKAARARGAEVEAQSLEMDLATLTKMEGEAERFGKAVGLDSASTFECIVDGPRHFFMEVNTRIQVEHRVSELCYALRFNNPNDPADHFDVESIVEMMALLALHKQRLPRPNRVPRLDAALEARLNATDRSLSPHAGGVIEFWSDPVEGEIRDDQGICFKNPDTGLFVRYKLAGAYDSNVALLVTHGADRVDSYQRLHEIIRVTKLHGHELSTNLEFHYGLVSWFLYRNVWAKPTTRFVVPYLTLVGQLAAEAAELDVDLAFHDLAERCKKEAKDPAAQKAAAEVLARKETLLVRPLERLLQDPHILSGWLSANQRHFEVVEGRVRWKTNPLLVLAGSYHFLNMNFRPDFPAAHTIWDHDQALLQEGLRFYEKLELRLGTTSWPELLALLQKPSYPGFDAAAWAAVRAAHAGFQLGNELLGLLPLLADRVQFFELKVNEDLTIHLPERLFDPELQAKMKKVLVPPPATRADEIVAAFGGMFYRREAPDRPPMVEVGQHFNAGDPLYIIEVMKMFNKVPATFAGTVEKVVMDGADGVIVSKGQPLFKVRPDEAMVLDDPAARAAKKLARTRELLAKLSCP
ncbi:MAG: biotin carboxylase [Deltaproteobacteria bacterium]|nr:biotin carboxylase [Deltaproteobacteria bacterium]